MFWIKHQLFPFLVVNAMIIMIIIFAEEESIEALKTLDLIE